MMLAIRIAATCLLVATAALAAPVSPALFQDLHWRLVGPFRGGRVLAGSGVPREPGHFYFRSGGRGRWGSTNARRTWGAPLRSAARGAHRAPPRPPPQPRR